MSRSHLVMGIMGALALALLGAWVINWFQSGRVRRRLRRSNRPIVSKAGRTSVKFSVKTPKK